MQHYECHDRGNTGELEERESGIKPSQRRHFKSTSFFFFFQVHFLEEVITKQSWRYPSKEMQEGHFVIKQHNVCRDYLKISFIRGLSVRWKLGC